MSLQRIKGQAVELSLVYGGQVQKSFNSISSFSIEAMLETMSQGFIGEKSERKDNIYKGCKFKLSVQIADKGVLVVVRSIIDTSKLRNPGVSAVVKATLNMPDGSTPRIIIPDCAFGAIPLDVASRSDYVKLDLEGEAEDFTILY